MIKKGINITVIFIISTFIQLVSQIVVTRIFGATFNLDIFLAAVALPTIFVTVIYGTLNDAFLPHYGEIKNKNSEKADAYFFSVLLTLGLLSFLTALVLSFFTDLISLFLYSSRGGDFVQNVSIQMKFMFLSIPLSVVATLFGSYYYVHKHFLRFPVAQAVGSIANVAIILLLASSMGIWSLVVAFVVNILIQILFVIPGSILKFRFQFSNITPLLFAWVPLILGALALRSDTLMIRSLAASLPDGYLVYLNLISKIFSLATSVMTIGIQVLLLPHLVEYFAKKDFAKAITTVNKTKIITLGISVVMTILVVMLTPLFVSLLFVGGKFTSQDAQTTISLVPYFVLPAIGWGINSVFFQPLLALKKQLHLGILNIISLVLGWGIGWIVKENFGALPGITSGLIVLLFSGIIGSELLWQYYKKKLKVSHSS
jgi:putative peptidoglycan lipid II flippase